MEEIHKVFVSKSGTTTITCPECNDARTASVAKFQNKQHVLKVKCPCSRVFSVRLDFRRNYRKPVNLGGNIRELGGRSGWISMSIKNVSKGGIGITYPGQISLKIGEEYEVKFSLDDAKKTIIQRKIIVRLIEGSYVGCQFSEPGLHEQEKALGFYLMP